MHLELHPDGSVTGDPEAHARLASALQLSVRWYTVAALAMALLLAPLGLVFFSHYSAHGPARDRMAGPWIAAVLANSASLWCMPFYSFLEGCGHVRAVAAMRFRHGWRVALCAWTPMLLHHGLYSPALVIAGQIVVAACF